MWENAYLSIKNQKASRALRWALDPGHILLASLRWQLSGSEAGPPPRPNPGSTPGVTNIIPLQGLTDTGPETNIRDNYNCCIIHLHI